MKNIKTSATKNHESLKELDLPFHYKNHEFEVYESSLDLMELSIVVSEWNDEEVTQTDLTFDVCAYELLEKIGFEIDVKIGEFMDGNTMTYDKHPTIGGQIVPYDVLLDMACEHDNIQEYLELMNILPTTKNK